MPSLEGNPNQKMKPSQSMALFPQLPSIQKANYRIQRRQSSASFDIEEFRHQHVVHRAATTVLLHNIFGYFACDASCTSFHACMLLLGAKTKMMDDPSSLV